MLLHGCLDDIFLTFGAPSHSASLTMERSLPLKLYYWATCFVAGTQICSWETTARQSQGSVEHVNCDVRDMLLASSQTAPATNFKLVSWAKICAISQDQIFPFWRLECNAPQHLLPYLDVKLNLVLVGLPSN